MLGEILGSVADPDPRDGKNSVLIAENGESCAKLGGDLFFTKELFEAFMHTAKQNSIALASTSDEGRPFYCSRIQRELYRRFVNIFLGL